VEKDITSTGVDGVYTLTNIDRAVTITITSDLDSTAASTATFTVNNNLYKNAFKATVEDDGSNYYTADSEKDTNDTDHKGNQYITADEGADATKEITIEPVADATSSTTYEVTDISVNGSPITLDESKTEAADSTTTTAKYTAGGKWTFKVNLDPETGSRENTIAVTMKAEGLDADMKVKIVSESTKFTTALLDDEDDT
jgi:hypothetical protein